MPTSIGYEVLRTWASTSTDAAPTTSSTFVTPTFFPNANSVEVAFDEITKGSDNTATVELWLKTRDADGTEQVIPYDTSVATISGATTSVVLGRSQYNDVPAGSWYARLGSLSSTGTAAITGNAYIRYYQQRD